MREDVNLKELREKNGFTQQEIAKFLGVDQSLVAKYESKERNIKLEYLTKLGALYGTNLIGEAGKEIKLAYRAQNLSESDLDTIACIKQIALNLRMMEDLNGKN